MVTPPDTPHYLCSQLVRLVTGTEEQWGNLEEIWASGAIVDCEDAVRVGIPVTVVAEGVELRAEVMAAVRDLFGWKIELTFLPSTRWSIEGWQPEHLLDPGNLR